MGSVWLAEHTALDVLCAIKFIDRERNTAEMRARFEQEAKAAAQLRSPYVVQVLDYGVCDGLPYIAMEYLQGEDLAQRLERELILSPADTYRIISHVCRGLTKAHAQGIVHRDLKPENIFLVRDEDEEIAKVVDFGIAKRGTEIEDTTTRPGALLGTPFYMSPEQARGNRTVDHRSDLWSLAVIAYQCLTGHLPFSSDGLGDVLSQIMYEALPVPSKAYADVPPGFDAWWRRAASRDPEVRFQSAKEFCEGLGEALEIYESIVVTDVTSRATNPELVITGAHSANSAVPAVTQVLMAPTGNVTDSPLSRTFGSELDKSSRKKRVAMGVAGAALVGLVAWLGLHDRAGDAEAQERAARAAAAAPVREPVAKNEAAPAPSASAEQHVAPSPSAAPASSSPRTAPQTVRPKPRKAAQAKPQKRRVDFGI
jgi:serine/threonine protein kinase